MIYFEKCSHFIFATTTIYFYSSRSTLKFSKCSLRLFILPQSSDSSKTMQEEAKTMADMLARFRYNVTTLFTQKNF